MMAIADHPGLGDVGALADLAEGKCHLRAFGERAILLIRTGDAVAAFENRCPHLGMPLDRGRLLGSRLVCPFHGAAFDVRSGKPLSGPAIEPLRALRAEVRDGRVLVGESGAGESRAGGPC